jgi:hypothetical protein
MAKEREKNKLISSFYSDKMSLSQNSTLNHKDGEKEVLFLITISYRSYFWKKRLEAYE